MNGQWILGHLLTYWLDQIQMMDNEDLFGSFEVGNFFFQIVNQLGLFSDRCNSTEMSISTEISRSSRLTFENRRDFLDRRD